jgi:hypothetical protein
LPVVEDHQVELAEASGRGLREEGVQRSAGGFSSSVRLGCGDMALDLRVDLVRM